MRYLRRGLERLGMFVGGLVQKCILALVEDPWARK